MSDLLVPLDSLRHLSTNTERTRFGRFVIRTTLGAVLLTLIAVEADAACEVMYAPSPALLDIEVYRNELSPDILLRNFMKVGDGAYRRCRGAKLYDYQFLPAFTGLTYVRQVTIGGYVHAAYQLSDTSPLLIFRMHQYHPNIGTHIEPVTAEAPTHWQFKSSPVGSVYLDLQVALVSRGGIMEGVPPRSIGGASALITGEGVPPSDYSLQLGIQVPAVTCTLYNGSVALRDAAPTDFSGPGSSAHEQQVAMALDCPDPAIGVTLLIADSIAPGNRSDTLTPTADSQGRGVALQLIWQGRPVPLQQPLTFNPSGAGSLPVPLKARYIRTSDAFVAGEVNSQAVITATYH